MTPELILDNLFIRPNVLQQAGDRVAGHKHHFSHVTYIVYGRVQITAKYPEGERTGEFEAGQFLLIRAGVEHEIVALEPSLFHCIYSHRTPQGQVTQHYTGWEPAYG